MDWVIKTMADIAEPINGIVDGPFGSNLKKTDYIDDNENGVPVLTTKNLHGDYSKNSVRYISKEKYNSLIRSTVFPGDIIVAKIGSIGMCGIYPLSCKKALIPANLLKISVLPSINCKFVFYYIKSSGFQERIKSISTATAQPAFNVTKFRRLPIPVPSLVEQEHIVARIEEMFSELDAGVETLKKTKEQLAVYRQAVLKEAFSKCPDKKTIREMSSIVTSGSRGWAQYYSESGAKFIRIGNLTRVGINIDLAGIQYVHLPDNTEGIRTKLNPNDVLVSITADLGSIGLVPSSIGEAYVNQHIAMIRFNNAEQGEFFAWYLRSEYGQKDLLKNKRGAGKLGLGLDDIRYAKVPVVSDEIAMSTVAEIHSRLSVCDSIEHTVDTALQQAEAMRQSILKEAFEGGL